MKKVSVRPGSLVVLAFGTLFLLAASANAQDNPVDLYKTQCASCHGDDGKADNPVGKALKTRDLTTDEVQQETVQEMIDITTNGKNLMPAYKDKLTGDQIAVLVTYIRATFGKGSAAPAPPPSAPPASPPPASNLKLDSKVPTLLARR